MSGLQRLIEDAFNRFSSRIALVNEDNQALSYDGLRQGVHALSGVLTGFLVGKGGPIAVCIPKQFEAVTSLLSIVRTGAAYIPLDPEAPASRNTYIINDARVSLVITTAELSTSLQPLLQNGIIHPVDILGSTYHLILLDYPTQELLDIPEDLAYILYTSGSTGLPKGVMITHQNAMCFIQWGVRTFSLTPEDVVSSIAPFHFDLSVFDLYAGLSSGATIVLISPASVKNPMILAELIDRFQISVWYATPTTLKMMLRFGRMDRYSHQSLRIVLFAGEVFPMTPLNELRARWSHASFYNLYGPTETNVCTFFALPEEIDPAQEEPYPIGTACSYALCFVDDGTQISDLVPGIEGELLVAGESVMEGYLNLPERNATSLLQHQGQLCYRTGDIIRVDQDLQIHYLSRKDRMVKRHGFRIELGEIEAGLHDEPGIAEAGVIQRMSGPDLQESRIIAYYTTREGQSGLEVPYLQSFLLGHIPSYMLPDQFIHLLEMPKTSTQKVDYSALKAMP